jgi:hypothetical protein
MRGSAVDSTKNALSVPGFADFGTGLANAEKHCPIYQVANANANKVETWTGVP